MQWVKIGKVSTKEDFLKKLGKHIKEVCERQNYSQNRIYLEGDFSSGTISKIWRGKVNVSVYTLHRLAETIGVTIEELVKIP